MQFSVRQFFEPESHTYSYFIIDNDNKQVVIIDPVKETYDRDKKFIDELGLAVAYIIDTHVHADHITSAIKLKNEYGGKLVIGAGSQINCGDILIKNNDEINFNGLSIKAISTPGHTNSCTSFYIEELKMVFTGDTLLIRSTGRTDFQQGSPEKLFDSLQTLFLLPEATKVLPAHDYLGRTSSTIGEEKTYNPRIAGKNKEEFVEIMSNLNLSYPKKIKESLPANLNCGDNKWILY